MVGGIATMLSQPPENSVRVRYQASKSTESGYNHEEVNVW